MNLGPFRQHFVADGYQRALQGHEKYLLEKSREIRARVTAAYADRMARAGDSEQWALSIEIERQINAELRRLRDEVAPRNALY